MKVIFLEDVPNVARAGEAKEVADGYGRNYLLPRKLAVLANSRASAVVEAQMKKIAKRQAQTEAEMAELAGKLNGMEITLKARAGAKGRLYGSITSADIADELGRSAGVVLDKRKIELAEPVHQLGTADVTVRFTHDIVAAVKLHVVADEVAEEKAEEAKVEAEKKAVEGVVEAEAKVEKKARAKKKVEEGEAKAEDKVEKKARAKAEKKAEEGGAGAKVEKKARAKKKAVEGGAEAKVEKKARAKKKAEEAGEKDAGPAE